MNITLNHRSILILVALAVLLLASCRPVPSVPVVSPMEDKYPFPSVQVAPRLAAEAITRENASKVTLIDIRGKGRMNEIAWSPDGKQIAVASSAGVFLVDTDNYQESRLSHSADAEAIAYSPDGALIASAEKTTVKLWDAESGKMLRELKGHTETIYRIAFSPAGDILASSASDGTIRLWDLNSGEVLKTIEGEQSFVFLLAFSSDGRQLVHGPSKGPIKVWDVASGKELRELGEDCPFAFSPGRAVLACGFRNRMAETIRIWDATSGKELRPLESVPGEGTQEGPFSAEGLNRSDTVRSVSMTLAYSPDGALLASSSFADFLVKIWDAASGEVLCEIQADPQGNYQLVFSPDGKRLAVGSTLRITIWEIPGGKELGIVTGRAEAIGGKAFASLGGWASGIQSLAYSPDGNQLAVGYNNGPVKLYEISTGAVLVDFPAEIGFINSVAFSPDGRLLAMGGGRYNPDKFGVEIWDVSTQKLVRRTSDFLDKVNSVAFSPDGKVLAAGWGHEWALTGSVRLWFVDTGEKLADLSLTENISANHPAVMNITFSPDGMTLAAVYADGNTRLWDFANQREQTSMTGSGGYGYGVAFSPDGSLLAVSGSSNTSDTTAYLWLWDRQTGEKRTMPSEHSQAVRDIAFNKDGQVVASASTDGSVRLWDAYTGRSISVLDVPMAASLAFSPDGTLLATGGWDGVIRLWGVTAR